MARAGGTFQHEPLLDRPAQGRVFRSGRRLRLADAAPDGRLCLDAAARYLQDIANDDSRDAGSPNPTAWVARRTVMHVERFPRYLDEVSLATWCSGVGSRWAERRYSVVAAGQETAGGGVINASTLWVHVDMATMRPIPVPESFAAQFAEAAGGRTVSARLHLPTKPPTAAAGADVAQAHFHPWPVRFVDLDVLGHVNNSVYWAMVEDQLAQRVDLVEPFTITLEHHDAIDADDEVLLTVLDSELGFDMWITTGDPGAPAESRRAAAVVRLDGQIQNDTGT